MSDELRAAAKRLSELCNYPKCEHIYNCHGSCQWCHQDRKEIEASLVSRAYLAEHPEDDGEDVKKHWLYETVDEKDRWIMWQGSKMLVYLKAKESYGIAWVLAGHTRGDVRRLCAALGIELKG